MRSRLAILSMLVLGMVLSTGGAGLAVSGFTSGNESASVTQYGTATPEGGTVLGNEESGAPGTTENNGGGGGGGPTQPTRQVESGAQGSGGGQLPFTGFAAIPILLGGVALLCTGLVMRRRTADES